MKTPCILVIVLALFLSLPLSGATGGLVSGRDNPELGPIILSSLDGQTIIKFWSGPQQLPVLLYDNWTIIIFSYQEEDLNITINGNTIFDGPINRTTNISYSAKGIDRARVDIWQGTKYYNWTNILVKHRDIGYVPPELEPPTGGYDKADIKKAQFKGALGVLIMGVISIPIVWLLVKTWRDRQGVRQW